MTRRQKIGIGLILLGILMLLAILLWPRPEPVVLPEDLTPAPVAQQPVQQPVELPEQPAISAPGEVEQQPAQPEQPADGRTSLSRLAASFSERYGSYSTHNDFENLLDLTVLMTAPLAARTEAYVDSQMSGDPLPDYSGVSTRALKPEIVEYDEEAGRAQVTVSTQRSYSDGRLMFQDIHLNFTKSGSQWLVSAVEWDENQENAR